MDSDNSSLITQYGAALFYVHLTEDILGLLLKDAAHFCLNGYQSPKGNIEKLPLEIKIQEFGKAFPDASDEVVTLDLLRKARNRITHAFISQVGSDLKSEHGQEQIAGMLARFTNHSARQRMLLGNRYDALIKHATTNCIDKVMSRPDSKFDARVENSQIDELLDQLDEHVSHAKRRGDADETPLV